MNTTLQQPLKKRTLAEILAERKSALSAIPPTPIITIIPEVEKPLQHEHNEQFSLSVILNDKQILAKELALAGKNFCLTGAAGTGKTTAQREIARELLKSDKLRTHTFRIQGTGERVVCPSIAFVAYTRIAAGNLRRAIHKDTEMAELLEHNITTVHNLLEYTPETYWDDVKQKDSFRFVPTRTAAKPLDITHLVIEESSMLGLDLWRELFAAMRPDTQIIFIGDINQLPPVFGPSILNYGLVQLPVINLDKVYRQAEGSEILDNAHRILNGEMVVEGKDFKIVKGGTVQHGQHKLSVSLGKTFPIWQEAGEYDPEQDIILSPFNKQELGTDNINNWIAQYLGQKRGAVVHEIMCGISKRYLAVGDRVMFNKQIGIIKTININGQYIGKIPQIAGTDLTRFGGRIASSTSKLQSVDDHDDDFELTGYENLSIDDIENDKSDDKRVMQCSHIVTLEMETGFDQVLSAIGDFSPQAFSLGYALTVHKAQGCEWRKVFIILHKDHSIMASRELLYTAVTRAKEQVVIIGKEFMIEKAIKNQRIKGNTVAEKIEYFNSGLVTNQGDIKCTK